MPLPCAVVSVGSTPAAHFAQDLSGVTEVRAVDEVKADVYADRGGPLIGPIVTAVQAAGAELSDVHIIEPSLETLFLHHTGRSLRD